MCGRGGHKLEINIPLQQIYANSNGGLIIKGSIISSEYGILFYVASFQGSPLERGYLLCTCT